MGMLGLFPHCQVGESVSVNTKHQGVASRGAKEGPTSNSSWSHEGMGDRGAPGMCWPKGHYPERGSAEQGMDGGDGKTREAAGAARARERQSR